MSRMEQDQLIAAGRRVIGIEADAVATLQARINEDFACAAGHILACTGRVVVTGMGKSGHIGGKIAATLASTGTPAFFVHPGEASHGDLGMLTSEDVVIALSYSGETGEILTILPLIKRLGIPLIALTGGADSTLAQRADVYIDGSVKAEACPLHLAPTASTTAALVLGDALAVALLEAREFTTEDFARSHPGGTLGQRLLLTVGDLMHTGAEMPVVTLDASLRAALLEMTTKGLGMTGVVDPDGRLAGVFTDGDLRRALDEDININTAGIASHMTQNPVTASTDMMAAEAIRLLEEKRIGGGGLVIVDPDNRPVGALNMQDLLKANVI